MHQIERTIDVLERHRVRDEIVDVDFAVHVPVDDLRHVGPAASATKGGAFPDAPCDQLKRSGFDLLTRARDTDDDGHTPAAMAALERLTHQIHVAHTLETVIRSAV